MFSDPVICLDHIDKCYGIYEKPSHRLLQMFCRGRKVYGRQFWALRDISLAVPAGEVVGVIGRNGAGKSTLLQLVCGTLAPTNGTISVKGRVAALLELGAGFNAEFTGRENVFLSASVIGMNRSEIDERFEEIVDFSGVREFIDQPVKTYSSGMYIRLAFSVAINVDPDILVIDEALSVGDGEFARRSFDRIMDLKARGKTILFCSHAMYQVEALCDTVLWLDNGIVRNMGEACDVIQDYNAHLSSKADLHSQEKNQAEPHDIADEDPAFEIESSATRITSIEASTNDLPPAKKIHVQSKQDEVLVKVRFISDTAYPVPSLGLVFKDENMQDITSTSTKIDNFEIVRSPEGLSEVIISFPAFPLLKGHYHLFIFLLCEKGIHVYDSVHSAAEVSVRQSNLELGVVSIPHQWSCEGS